MSDNGEEPDRKRQRLTGSEVVVMDVNSSAKWDFLAPWCEELNGQLVSISGDFIRVLGPRRKREKPLRFDLESEEEEEKVDPEQEKKEIEKALCRTREAIELLSLVAEVDQRAFHMLMTQQCGLRLDDEESEEEEEEFRPMIPGEEDDDFLFIDEGESEDGEEEDDDDDEEEEDDEEDQGDQNETGAAGSERAEREDDNAVRDEDGGGDDEEEEDEDERDDVLVLPPDTLKSERRLERETFISPRFDFISLSGIPGGKEAPQSLFAEWEKLFLAESPEYQPSAAYKKAKECILDMLPADRKVQPRIQRSLEIPVSLELNNWAKTVDQLAGHLKELGTFMEAMRHRAQKLDSTAVQELRDCARTFMYSLTQISMTLSYRDKMTDLFVDRLLEVFGYGIPVSELLIYLRDGAKGDPDRAVNLEILAKLLIGMLIRPLNPTQKQIPSFTALNIDCDESALWRFEALCSALAVSQAPIKNLTLTHACNYRMKDELRRRYWKLLAHTFFHARSSKQGQFSSVRGLHLPDAELTLDDLAEITAAIQEKEHQETINQQWDICQKKWLLREGTLVQFTEKDGNARVLVAGDPVALLCDTQVELVESNSNDGNDDTKSEWLDVVIPGYGQCCVPRDSVVAVPREASDRPSKSIGEPLKSLSLSLKTEADGVPGLIKQIGWSLEKLSLSFHREVDVNAMVPTILRSCPRMSKLSLRDSYIDLDLFSTTYESMSGEDAPVIRTLKFQDFYGIGDGEGKLFMKRLGDPTTRLARDLRVLSLLAEEYAEPLDHPTLSELWISMGKNTNLEKLEVMVSLTMWSVLWKRRLRQFHGQVLPPRLLSLPCKLAFLSVCLPPSDSDAKKTTSAAHHLDRRVLSLIFEFAATRVVRSVKIWG
ncbi:hypothetical protein PR001_g16537 [Phytophthora rubi]|uniref:Uncharacterized protein n=1 Tax=Phytophthora rubi TaxID=129364 RepID=A0A6A3KEB3_9STRA|nr:hypothetical protein PR002_g16779 [Phytophthora rubi]KAE9009086.1 hypothetical protein PR001_g16537 [Phytophthora rubi]